MDRYKILLNPSKIVKHHEIGHSASKATRCQLEDIASKCLTIARGILPGASDAVIEDQATDLMRIPAKYIHAIIRRRKELIDSLDIQVGQPSIMIKETCPKCNNEGMVDHGSHVYECLNCGHHNL